MRLLIVGFPSSIHLVKAVSMLHGQGWDVHVAPSAELPWHDGFDHCTLHHVPGAHEPPVAGPDRAVVVHEQEGSSLAAPRHRSARALARLIDDLRPDIVHAHELQHAAYLALAARDHLSSPAPRWIVSNWGSDIYFYAREAAHRAAVREVLVNADAYWAECERDVQIARAEGFRGITLPVLPIAGGYDLDAVAARRDPAPPSRRRTIAVKGYDHRVGRGHTALDALDMCGDLLAGYEVALYGVNDDEVVRHAEDVARAHGATATILRDVPYDQILRLHGRARVSLGLSISDGISTSFVEALLGGSFPVQSSTSCGCEWAVPGEGALYVDPTEVSEVARAVRRALTDDELVDTAQTRNDRTVAMHLDARAIRAAVVGGYRLVMATGGALQKVGA